MKSMQWLGLLLILFAVLTGFGLSLGVLPILSTGMIVLVGVAGTWLYLKSKVR